MQKELESFVEIASVSVGGSILFATDDFFAVAEMMLDPKPPVWIEDKYGPFGKWMDGWVC